MPTRKLTLLLAALAALLAGCSSGGDSGSSSQSSTSTGSGSSQSTQASTSPTATPSYHPGIRPADFTTTIDNRYYPLKPGTTKMYVGKRDGLPMRHEIIVTRRTRTVMGVPCVVVLDTVTSNGALVEKTEDWFAQKKDGGVWYFGENTAEYVNGTVSSTHGTWEAGVDNAVPGVIMQAHPKVGSAYYQEFRPGEAEDRAKILSLDSSIKVPSGTYHHVITTEDSDPLNPDKTDKKWYAPGIGVVHSVRIKSSTTSEFMSLLSQAGA
jgi:hypothetical protein